MSRSSGKLLIVCAVLLMSTTGISYAEEPECVQLVDVERLFSLAQAAEVAPGAATHSAAHTGVLDGHQLDGTVTWTAPPIRLCQGDEFSVKMTAANNGDKFVSGMSYVAAVAMLPTNADITIVSCSNPPGAFGPSEASAGVSSTMAAHTNVCTYRVEQVTKSSQPRGVISADLTAKPAFGKVTYLYR